MITPSESNSPPLPSPDLGDEEVRVTLPCTPADFAEFIAGLLGKPQTISRKFYFLFEIDSRDVEDIHHLIVQRVLQQNDGNLVQFTCAIHYDDASSVRINSFDDFRRYNEVRPLRSVAVALSWIFLIKFPDRRYPEKQEINVAFSTQEFYKLRRQTFFDDVPGFSEITVNYTQRSWGTDVDALIKGHIEAMAVHDSPPLIFLHHWRIAIGWAIAVLFFFLGVHNIGYYIRSSDEKRSDAVSQFFAQDKPQEDIMFEAMHVILDRAVTGSDRFPSPMPILIPVILFGSIVLGAGLGLATSQVGKWLMRRSHIVLTKRSQAEAANHRALYRRKIAGFLALQAINIGAGLFVAYFGSMFF